MPLAENLRALNFPANFISSLSTEKPKFKLPECLPAVPKNVPDSQAATQFGKVSNSKIGKEHQTLFASFVTAISIRAKKPKNGLIK